MPLPIIAGELLTIGARRIGSRVLLQSGKFSIQGVTTAKNAGYALNYGDTSNGVGSVLGKNTIFGIGRTRGTLGNAYHTSNNTGLFFGNNGSFLAGLRTKTIRKATWGHEGYSQLRKDVRKVLVNKVHVSGERLMKRIQPDMNQIVKSCMPQVNVNTANFDSALAEYIKYSKKDLETVLNQKAYWVIVGTISATKFTPVKEIGDELDKPSKTSPTLTVGQILALQELRREGVKKPTKGELHQRVMKLKRKRKGTSKFLRSGWIPAMKALGAKVENKRPNGSTKSDALETRIKKGKDKGGGHVARMSNWQGSAAGWNNVEADNSARAHSLMAAGLTAGLNREADSMRAYVQKKLDERANQFNRR